MNLKLNIHRKLKLKLNKMQDLMVFIQDFFFYRCEKMQQIACSHFDDFCDMRVNIRLKTTTSIFKKE